MQGYKGKQVRAKKHLGQHFLNDNQIAGNIVGALTEKVHTPDVLEVGPGMGILTRFLLEHDIFQTTVIDIDHESVLWLREHLPELDDHLIEGDFLHLDFHRYFPGKFSLIGNFPYNISSQIVFRVIESREQIPLMVGMFQKEVAERIGAKPRTKDYGIISVLTQAYYEVEYLFTVPADVFVPPPKVQSGVIRLTRRKHDFDVPERDLFRTVKTAFGQRRKKLRNAIQIFQLEDTLLEEHGYINRRAEELSVEEFVHLANLIRKHGKDTRG